jgi:curved DNA-binding protein CbpA
MENLMIDGTEYNAWFILGVTSEDSLEHITKEYRKKAKILHPDKMSIQDRMDPKKVLKRSKQFKILVDCFEYISNVKQSYHNTQFKNQEINVRLYDDLPQQSFDNSDQLKSFNKKFTEKLQKGPNDFGYKTDRIAALDDDGKNFGDLIRERSQENFKPNQLFDKKSFNPDNFNKAFEYQQQQFENPINDQLVIHKTSDGFNGYNSATLDNCANVSNFNGVMLVGDSFGQSGIGYNEGNYSDYKQTFTGAQNPDKLDIPKDFKAKGSKVLPLTKAEIETQMRLRKSNIESTGSGSKADFSNEEKKFLEKQQREMKEKSIQDKQFILEYQHLFDPQTIQDALNGGLITSADYQRFDQE